MRGMTIECGTWKVGDTPKIGVFSDPHIEIGGDNSRLERALDRAVGMGCRLAFNGDLSDFIYFLDKRYVPEREESEGQNAKIDYAVDYIVEFLSPYKDYIDFIGYGNHDTVAVKKYLTDPVARVCARLGCKKGSYRALVRYKWRNGDGGGRSFMCYFHHGGRGVATQNKGILAIRNMVLGAEADCYIVGHGHRAAIDAGEPRHYLDKSGNVQVKVRKGMQVPGFQHGESKSGTGYEDQFYQPTVMGWGLINLKFRRKTLGFNLSVEVEDE